MEKSISLWEHFTLMNNCYLTAVNCCMDDNWEIEAEDYWEKLENDISKMPSYQQKEAKEYQFNLSETIALTEGEEIDKKLVSKEKIETLQKELSKLYKQKMEETE